MRRLRPAPSGVLPALLLVVALLLSSLPAAARAQGGDAPGPTAAEVPATPGLALPRGPGGGGVAREPAALQAGAGMRPAPAGPGLEGQAEAFPEPAAPAPGLAQAGFACTPLLGNPQVDNGYEWAVLTPFAYVASNAYYSAPHSLVMFDGDDGGPDATPSNDAFGQDFYFPATAQSALIEFQIVYSAREEVDKVYYEFYLVDDDGFLAERVGQGELFDPADPQDNNWNLISDYVTIPEIIDPLKGKRAALVLRTETDGLAPLEEVYFDNIQVTACDSSDPAGASNQIGGRVTQGGVAGQAVADVLLLLAYETADGELEVVRTTFPDAQGNYSFKNLIAPSGGDLYQVWYVNPGDPGRLSYWAGPEITGFTAGQAGGGDFDIGDIALSAPVNYARAAFPVDFRWQTRPGQGGEFYYLCVYDVDTFDEVCGQGTQGGSFRLQASLLLDDPDLGFEYDKLYGWYVRIAGPDYDGEAFAHLGAGSSSQLITFLRAAETPTTPPPPEPNPPPAGTQKSWTVMFYIAGDDKDLTRPQGNARGMVDVLTRLAALSNRYPEVNVVALFDFFETQQSPLAADLRGTQLCHFKPGSFQLSASCQQLGELNTGDPATLTRLINAGLSRYPASRTMLVVMGHGSTVSGVAGDQTASPDDSLTPNEIVKAFDDANLDDPARKLDLLVFYACLMGSFETAAIVSPFADYMVASPNITTLIDINDKIFDRARANPNSPRAVAGGIVDSYNAALTSYNATSSVKLSIAMTAYDLGRVGALLPQVDALGQALRDNLTLPEVLSSRDDVQAYDSSAPFLWGLTAKREDALVDLRHLATLLQQRSQNSAIDSAAAGVLGALGQEGSPGAVVVRRVAVSGKADLREGGDHTFANAFGLAIYFPNGSPDGGQTAQTGEYLTTYRQTSLALSPWTDLVDATRSGLPSLPRRGQLGSVATVFGSGTTLQNFVTPELFPVASSMPSGGSRVYLPYLRR